MNNPSNAQLAYVNNHKKMLFFIRVARIGILLAFLLLWELSS